MTSCGVPVTLPDGRLVLGQATGLRRCDIPKEVAEPGESHRDAAMREWREESGLIADPAARRPLGVPRYRPGQDLARVLAELPPSPRLPGT